MHRACLTNAISRVLVLGVAFAAGPANANQDEKPRSGKIIGELKSQKNTQDGKNTIIEVLAPGEEKARAYHVLYDPDVKGPLAAVLTAVRAAKVGERVELEWVQTGHGPAIKVFKVIKPGGDPKGDRSKPDKQ